MECSKDIILNHGFCCQICGEVYCAKCVGWKEAVWRDVLGTSNTHSKMNALVFCQGCHSNAMAMMVMLNMTKKQLRDKLVKSFMNCFAAWREKIERQGDNDAVCTPHLSVHTPSYNNSGNTQSHINPQSYEHNTQPDVYSTPANHNLLPQTLHQDNSEEQVHSNNMQTQQSAIVQEENTPTLINHIHTPTPGSHAPTSQNELQTNPYPSSMVNQNIQYTHTAIPTTPLSAGLFPPPNRNINAIQYSPILSPETLAPQTSNDQQTLPITTHATLAASPNIQDTQAHPGYNTPTTRSIISPTHRVKTSQNRVTILSYNYNDSSRSHQVGDSTQEVGRDIPICRRYLMKVCPYGRSGIMKGEKCRYNHPVLCYNEINTGKCKKGQGCYKYHPKICQSSRLYNTCYDDHCSKHHIKGTHRRREVYDVAPSYHFLATGGREKERRLEEDWWNMAEYTRHLEYQLYHKHWGQPWSHNHHYQGSRPHYRHW